MPDVAPVERALRGMVWPARSALVFEASGIEAFDTGGAVVLYGALMEARRQGCELRSPRGRTGLSGFGRRSEIVSPRVPGRWSFSGRVRRRWFVWWRRPVACVGAVA